jgi:hypothetical protein
MAKAEILTIKAVTQLINFNGIYLLGYAWLFGMCRHTNFLEMNRV